MYNEQFSRLLRLARKTGDRLIVTDAEGNDPVVVLPLDEYESLVDNAYGYADPVDVVDVREEDEEALPSFDVDEADFDQDELERGALRGLWEDPAEAAIEVIERPESSPDAERSREDGAVEPHAEPVLERPRGGKPVATRPENTREGDGGEEQFYLEPI